MASVGLTLADVEIGEHRFGVVGVGGVIVTHARRGEGLLRPTLEAALERAATLGPDKAMLFCSLKKVPLYERFGFVHDRTRPVVAGGQQMRPRFMWRPLRDGRDVALRRRQSPAIAVLTSTKASTARSMSSVECAADICVRIRAWPRGTTGNENAIT